MFSDVIQATLEREVAGQPRAINLVVRGVTRVVSRLTPRERPFAAYLLIGPPGTGKTHLVRTVTRILNGTDRTLVTVNGSPSGWEDPWASLVAQLAPLARRSAGPAPVTVICVEYVERSPRELAQALANALETGQILVPGGARLELEDSLVFITSGLCSGEILDETSRIGFAGSHESDEGGPEQQRLYDLCTDQIQEQCGRELLAQLDALIVFHRLEPEHLAAILDRRIERLNTWLSQRAVSCEFSEAARAFLLERGRKDLRMGARQLEREHQRYVEFPLADLLVSGRIPGGGKVAIEHRPGADHLHFTVNARALPLEPEPADKSWRPVPVIWPTRPQPAAS